MAIRAPDGAKKQREQEEEKEDKEEVDGKKSCRETQQCAQRTPWRIIVLRTLRLLSTMRRIRLTVKF